MISALLLVIIVAVIVGREPSSAAVSVEQTQTLMADGEYLLLDVRTPQEFEGELGHLPGAVLIPVQELEQRLSELEQYKERKIIAYCRTGNRSGKATSLLNQKGYNVVNMLGGMVEWNEKHLPAIYKR